MTAQYKIQYFNKQHQLVESDWTNIDVPIIEPCCITGIWFKEQITQEQYKEFMKQFEPMGSC
jgi:hypothetical protein